jgi:hemolysin activation/secretion protein
MGGPNSVRAYPVSEYIRDKAIFISTEWIISAPNFTEEPGFFGGRRWNEVVKLSVFLDYAKGQKNDPNDFEKKEENISGAGAGLEFKFTETSFLKMEAAVPISNQDASNGDNTQLWFSAGFEF